MNRSVVLVLALLAWLPGSSWAQEEESVAAAVRCVNCDDPELLAWLQPLDPEAPRFTCALTMALTIEADGLVAEAYPLEAEVPPLCERRATLWARATRWTVERGAPVTANLPLEFEIQQAIAPRCLEGCDPNAVLDELRRAGDREGGERPAYARQGFRCETTLGLRIDEEGRVTDTDVRSGSRNRDCVQVFQRWAERSRWSAAYNRGVPVVVWIAQPISIQTD